MTDDDNSPVGGGTLTSVDALTDGDLFQVPIPNSPDWPVAPLDADGLLRTRLGASGLPVWLDERGALVLQPWAFLTPAAATPEAERVSGVSGPALECGPVCLPCREPEMELCPLLDGRSDIMGGHLDETDYITINGVAIYGVTFLPDDADGALRAAIDAAVGPLGVAVWLDADANLVLSAGPDFELRIMSSTAVAAQMTGLMVAAGEESYRCPGPACGVCGGCPACVPGLDCAVREGQGAIAGGQLDAANAITINGVVFDDLDVRADDADGALVRAINERVPHVVATLDAHSRVALTARPGHAIRLSADGNASVITGLDLGPRGDSVACLDGLRCGPCP